MNRHRLFLITILASIIFIGSCVPSPYYQKNYSIPQNAWDYTFTPEFRLNISDTSVYYHMYFIIRHTEAYPFSNIWLQMSVKEPGDSSFKKTRLEIPLATPAGQWMGRGMGEIWEQRLLITGEQDRDILGKPGMYEFRLGHDMRLTPLPEVLQVGLRIEKGAAKNSSPR